MRRALMGAKKCSVITDTTLTSAKATPFNRVSDMSPATSPWKATLKMDDTRT